mgnify:CR=1 FL=1
MRRGNTDPPHNLIMVHPALTNYDPRRSGYYNKVTTLKKLGGGTGYSPMGRLWNVTKALAYPPKYPMGYRSSKYVTGVRRTRRTPFRGTNRVYSRKRRGSYRRSGRMRTGTKVRKHALGLFEGKRKNEIVRDNLAQVARFVTRINLLGGFGAGLTVPTGGDSIVESVFAGRECFMRGIKMTWLIENKSASQPIDVRIMCGWRNINAYDTLNISSDTSAIFRNTTNKKAPQKLLETAHGTSATENGDNAFWMLGNAPISKKHFHCEKDMTFRLGPTGTEEEQVFGSNVKRLEFWWELNNKRFQVKKSLLSTASTTDLEANANWWPVCYYYHVTPLAAGQAAATCDYYKSWQVYYKDPLG